MINSASYYSKHKFQKTSDLAISSQHRYDLIKSEERIVNDPVVKVHNWGLNGFGRFPLNEQCS